MDAKSLAKSKRAHSLHQGKKIHPNPKSKAPTIPAPADGNAKKPSVKQTKEKSRQFHGSPSALPSNWDRYEEEFDSGSQDPSLDSASRASDVFVPKSKGADFAHLISEAQSQLQSQCSPNLESFTSFNDILPDFNQGASSMLSVRGKGILSWIGDDNFIVDDNTTAGYEASFLSMDLHALAAQLAKLDISRRLFIEADLLPPELRAEGSKETISQESVQAETSASGHTDVEKNVDHKSKVMSSIATSSYGSLPLYRHHGGELVDQNSEAMPSTTTSSNSSVPIFPSQGAKLLNTVKDDSKQLDETDLGEVEDDSMARFNMEKKTLRFEALAAEAELDMLLGSFSETKLYDSSGISKKPTNGLPVAQLNDSLSFLDGLPSVHASPQPPTQGSSSSRSIPITVDLDDTIDNLLEETSNLKNQKDVILPREETAAPSDLPSLSSSSHSGSKVLDDFDSWLDTI